MLALLSRAAVDLLVPLFNIAAIKVPEAPALPPFCTAQASCHAKSLAAKLGPALGPALHAAGLPLHPALAAHQRAQQGLELHAERRARRGTKSTGLSLA